MFARLSICIMKSETIDEAMTLYKESVLPVVKLQRGFSGVNYLNDLKTGKMITITFWDTVENIIANEESGYYQDQLDKFKDIFTEPPLREVYEVGIHE